MGIDKISNDILSHITQERVNKATSGKKDDVQAKDGQEIKRTLLEDVSVFSQDAKKLQETEAILQNALAKLKEMDGINEENLASIKEKISNDFYDNDAVLDKIVDDIFSNDEIKHVVENRQKAKAYVEKLHEYDKEAELDQTKLNSIKEKINKGFYNTSEVYDRVAVELLNIMEA